MGNLFLINNSFELANIPVLDRDKIFTNFCKALDSAKGNKDCIYAVQEIYTRQYSYGTFFFDFLLKSWPEIIAKPELRGVSSTALSLYQSILFAIPNLIQIISSKEEFEILFSGAHNGHSGFKFPNPPSPYVCCLDTWQHWKILWLVNHQFEILWEKNTDNFLPNKEHSDSILWHEVIKHSNEDKLYKYKGNKAITFYEEVMKMKGPETEAYTIEIGKKIAEANYYKYESKISDNERDLAGGSLRTIFSLFNRNSMLQYISLDHRHGMFEYHDSNGNHLGEYKFDGSYNSEAQPSHNLKTL